MSFSRLDEIQNEVELLGNELMKEILVIRQGKDTQIRAEEKELVNNIGRVNLNVLQLQDSIPNLNPVILGKHDITAIPILEAVYLNIEHEYNKEKQPKYLDLNHELQKRILIGRLKNDKSDLQILIKENRDNLIVAQKKIENVEQGIIEDKRCIDIMEEKKSELNNQRKGKQEGLELKLQNQLKQLKDQYKVRLEKLRDFLSEYYPIPNEERKSPWRRTSSTPFKSMADTLQLLLRKTIESPHDPWIVVDDTFYEQYINALKEVRVIVKHPNNKKLISLDL